MELYSIASGSSGNCICVGNSSMHFLVDAGISAKRIEQGLFAVDLKPEELSGILITHEHTDHIGGLGVIARRYGLPIYASAGTKQAILNTKSVGTIDESLFTEITPGYEFEIGEFRVEPIAVSHDAAEPVAYRFFDGGKSAAVITDLGTYDEKIIGRLQNLDAVLIEANHDVHMLMAGRYPYPLKRRILGEKGHLSNELCGRLLAEILHDRFQAVLLGHLSKENNYPALAYEAVRLEVTMGDNPYRGDDFPISIAKREEPSEIIHIR